MIRPEEPEQTIEWSPDKLEQLIQAYSMAKSIGAASFVIRFSNEPDLTLNTKYVEYLIEHLTESESDD